MLTVKNHDYRQSPAASSPSTKVIKRTELQKLLMLQKCLSL